MGILKNKIENEEWIDLRKFCSIKIGGKGKIIFFPKNKEELSLLIREFGEKIIPLGLGSNIIFKDGEIDKIFIHTKNLKKIELFEKNGFFYIKAEAGVSFKNIIEIVKKYNLEGFEYLSGIPATIGGAVAMNAGAFGVEVFDILEDVEWIDNNGNIIYSKKEEIEHSYRYTRFQKDGFVFSATLKLKKSDKDISQIIKNHLIQRNSKQPLDLPTAGSTYKNPENSYAGLLLEKAGYKGKRINDIGFSEKHANFLVNYGNASFKDLMNLLQSAERDIKNLFNINLEREVKIIG
ncbi:UDP-N-acetylmuramate dehydrogenase [Venenivibrio stagnispumantis]|uniref:UDP-N-acetylenolpyruvoylglucosamine reductase n=1 Tax=Venenivibrio stagnispumantis TaxID=407998 RepID=A0AA45WIU5_9AQUI|nr:UDP-N-acetylmuramate dehydrogenase [Venenivibrio stagnispumantis]MCW4573936.1 UDP-N-acetylmuramate dehydrogenase [Venenivibrio stagnispumantis]SMP01084.1 UDP-N-acetylmuramate dehydrogenase [Venenivibrio stagnispumantis]